MSVSVIITTQCYARHSRKRFRDGLPAGEAIDDEGCFAQVGCEDTDLWHAQRDTNLYA